mmetsp:Transcript_41418/g.137728  ORF Transcript_41418/g.137728 Transcript_41418/m.137728 type:complete len:350 (-) Transcript_41418:599-1648(-)
METLWSRRAPRALPPALPHVGERAGCGGHERVLATEAARADAAGGREGVLRLPEGLCAAGGREAARAEEADQRRAVRGVQRCEARRAEGHHLLPRGDQPHRRVREPLRVAEGARGAGERGEAVVCKPVGRVGRLQQPSLKQRVHRLGGGPEPLLRRRGERPVAARRRLLRLLRRGGRLGAESTHLRLELAQRGGGQARAAERRRLALLSAAGLGGLVVVSGAQEGPPLPPRSEEVGLVEVRVGDLLPAPQVDQRAHDEDLAAGVEGEDTRRGAGVVEQAGGGEEAESDRPARRRVVEDRVRVRVHREQQPQHRLITPAGRTRATRATRAGRSRAQSPGGALPRLRLGGG